MELYIERGKWGGALYWEGEMRWNFIERGGKWDGALYGEREMRWSFIEREGKWGGAFNKLEMEMLIGSNFHPSISQEIIILSDWSFTLSLPRFDQDYTIVI